jgi:integrase
VRVKEKALGYFVDWFSDLEIGQVNASIAEDYMVMIAKGRRKSAANTYLDNFKPFWRWMYDRQMIESNPFAHVGRYKTDRQVPKYFTCQDLERMARYFDLLWRVRFCLGLLGCRRGEMLNVLVKEVHLETRDPHLEIQHKADSDTTWAWATKNRSIRYVGLPCTMAIGTETVELHRDIVQLMESLPANQPYLCIEPGYYERDMKLKAAGKMSQNLLNDPCGNFQRLFHTRQRWAGIIETKRFHELRAAYITCIVESQGLKQAADAAGIKSIQTAARYDRKQIMTVIGNSNKITANSYKTYVP